MQAWLARLFERRGRSYLAVCISLALFEANGIMVPMSVLVAGRYEGLSLAQSSRTGLISVPLLTACMLVGLYTCRRPLGLLQAWCRGERDPARAQQTAHAAHEMPLRFLVVSLTLGILIPQPIGVGSTLSMIQHKDLKTFVLLFVGGLFFALWGIIVLGVWLELTMRPIVASIAMADQNVVTRPVRRFGVNLQLLVGISSATLVGACYAGSLTAPPGAGIQGLESLLAVTVGVSVVTGVLFVALFGTLILTPVRELTAATRRVADGNLESKIPLATNDELGDMAESFNLMVDGLRDRSRLREENTALVAELRASRERIVAAGNLARKRVEQDLHDGAQQMLVLIRIKLGMLDRRIGSDPALKEAIDELRTDLDVALQELRDLAHGLYPAVLDSAGVHGAISQAAERLAVPVSIESSLTERFHPEIEAAVYFSCLEAMQNASKHAGESAEVKVRLGVPDGVLTFEVADTGVGFDPANVAKSVGLQNLVDRLGAIGGTVHIDSRPGKGTTVLGRLPLAAGDLA
jgi:signal transduction histidine kinase